MVSITDCDLGLTVILDSYTLNLVRYCTVNESESPNLVILLTNFL